MSQSATRAAAMREYYATTTAEERTQRTEAARVARQRRIAALVAENEDLRAELEELRALVAA